MSEIFVLILIFGPGIWGASIMGKKDRSMFAGFILGTVLSLLGVLICALFSKDHPRVTYVLPSDSNADRIQYLEDQIRRLEQQQPVVRQHVVVSDESSHGWSEWTPISRKAE